MKNLKLKNLKLRIFKLKIWSWKFSNWKFQDKNSKLKKFKLKSFQIEISSWKFSSYKFQIEKIQDKKSKLKNLESQNLKSVRLSVRLFVCPSVHLTICPSVHMPLVYLSICLSVHLSIRLSIHFYIHTPLPCCRLTDGCTDGQTNRWMDRQKDGMNVLIWGEGFALFGFNTPSPPHIYPFTEMVPRVSMTTITTMSVIFFVLSWKIESKKIGNCHLKIGKLAMI